jgi:ferredoxin-NADP reductase
MNTSLDDHLAICVRHIPQGALSPVLAQAEVGQMFDISEAFGYFTYQPSEQMPVFVATGTGIAPFVAYARSGVSRYCLLHGVRSADELYYREKVEPPAVSYIPCVSELPPNHATDGRVFAGRVTRYLQKQLPPGVYDFYLCGRGEMVRDAMEIIDQRFEGSRVFTEVFF